MNKIEYLETLLSLTIGHDKVLEAPQNYCLIDIRNAPKQMKKDKIKGSIEIPAKDLVNQLHTLDQAKTLVVYDWNAGTTLGKEALLLLLKNGFEAYELSCAIEGWKGMRLPVEIVSL
ncbi:rhodanese-like domain-containing protein [Isobaculum melis]|uniref:Rhodanese-related sulfurtransferase n=1 Tax=Isobaculum melis TaxID=142588 RepID=A0A1H9UH05_9LACT|nr:rhodanese-like domain-containing protein [Isobaculum melis]SES08558.1 Rhodanese-related sulfurtransferase [Isobaculum melis]